MTDLLKAMEINEAALEHVNGGTQRTTLKDDGNGVVYCPDCNVVLDYKGCNIHCHKWTCPECGEYYYKSIHNGHFWKGFIKESDMTLYMLNDGKNPFAR